jgi:putative DNA-invertase from lambdoid prophage Rac
LGAVAELERNLIKERVHMGISRARKQGKRLGRPTVVIDREKVRQLAVEGKSIKAIAKENGIARATVRSILGKPRCARVAEIPPLNR